MNTKMNWVNCGIERITCFEMYENDDYAESITNMLIWKNIMIRR